MQPFMRGQIIPIDGGAGPVRFQFNPHRIDGPTARAEYAELRCPGGIQPFLQFACRDVPEVHFDLVFAGQGLEDSYVLDAVNSLQRFTEPLVQGQGINRPPRVKFILGNFPRQTCVVIQVNPVFTQMHSPVTATPLHAVVAMTLWRWRESQ